MRRMRIGTPSGPRTAFRSALRIPGSSSSGPTPSGRFPGTSGTRPRPRPDALRAETGDHGAPGTSADRPTSAGASRTWRSIRPTPHVAFAGTRRGRRAAHDRRRTALDAALRRAAHALHRGGGPRPGRTPAIVYAGTGEVNPGGGSVAYGGVGRLPLDRSRRHLEVRSGSRTAAPSAGSASIPTNPQRIYVAAMGDLWSKGPDRGVYRTTDGGASWQKVLFLSDSTGVRRPDPAPRPAAAPSSPPLWERIRRPAAYQLRRARPAACTSTTDGGDTWSPRRRAASRPRARTSGASDSPSAPPSPTVMHAIYADRTGYFAGLYRTHQRRRPPGPAPTTARSPASTRSYGWWFGNCRLHPTDPEPDLRARASTSTARTNGGTSWSETSGGMHVDHHALEFGPGASPVIYEGNDGGLYRSTNGGTVWTMLPDQPITQFYRLAPGPAEPQRASTAAPRTTARCARSTGGLDDWANIYGGDGFQPAGPPDEFQPHLGPVPVRRPRLLDQRRRLVGVGATGGISAGDRHELECSPLLRSDQPGPPLLRDAKGLPQHERHDLDRHQPDLTGGPAAGSQGQVYGTLTTHRRLAAGRTGDLGRQRRRPRQRDDERRRPTGPTSPPALPDRWITTRAASPLDRETCLRHDLRFPLGQPAAARLPHHRPGRDLDADRGQPARGAGQRLVLDPAGGPAPVRGHGSGRL